MTGIVQCTFAEPNTCHSSYTVLPHITSFSLFPFLQTVSPTIPFHYLFFNGLLYNPILFPNCLDYHPLPLHFSNCLSYAIHCLDYPYHYCSHLSLICHPLPFPFSLSLAYYSIFLFFPRKSPYPSSFRIFPFSQWTPYFPFFPVVSVSFLFPSGLPISLFSQ
jgi:hypothetical protein